MSHWEPIVGVAVGFPAIGFAIRMVIRSLADGIARVKSASHPPLAPADPAQGRRIAELESEVASLRDEVGRLTAVESFYAQLQAPRGGAPGTGGEAPG